MATRDPIRIRPMNETDHDFIIGLAERFNNFPLKWRDREQMRQAHIRLSKESLKNVGKDADLFIAEQGDNRLGYIHIEKSQDFFTKEEQAFILSLAVTKESEGLGVGRLLMQKAEEWAQERGIRLLSLNVFALNEKALRLYRKMGYDIDSMRMVKILPQDK